MADAYGICFLQIQLINQVNLCGNNGTPGYKCRNLDLFILSCHIQSIILIIGAIKGDKKQHTTKVNKKYGLCFPQYRLQNLRDPL